VPFLHLLLTAVLGLGAAPPDAVEVLHDWDERRAEAWAADDGEALRALYADGSAAGRHDVAMLRAWRARGLHVEGMRTQLIAVRVRHCASRTLVLEVVDRLAGAHAEPGGLALPRGAAARRTVTMQRTAGEWRVVGVQPMLPDSDQS
jgi:hypothetical protein